MYLLRRVKRCAWLILIVAFEVSCINPQRSAVAGAPKGNSGNMVDEDFDSHPLSLVQNPNSQQPSTAANTNGGEHENGLLSFFF